MINETDKSRENSLSQNEVRKHSQKLLGQYFQRLMEIPEAKLAVEEAEFSKKQFNYNLGPWQFEGRIDLKLGELALTKKIPDENEQDGEIDHVIKIEINPNKISYTESINKPDSPEIIRTLSQSTNTMETLTEAYEFNLRLKEIPSEPEDF